ncbi:porin, partial [Salinimicrobium sp. CDJ15-91]|nr:porin [Salinimicrobium oceani]
EDYAGADFAREQRAKLAVGLSYDFNDNAVKTRSNMGSYMLLDNGFFETDIMTYFVDAIFKYNGFSALGEFAYRDAEDVFAINPDRSLTGAAVNVGHGLNLQAGYLFLNNFQVVGRYTTIDLDDRLTEVIEDQYTIALSKY